jgi:hypothetical protein
MTTPHAIAAHFTVAARQAAVAGVYTTPTSGLRPGTYRRTARGCCPVGIMLQADGYGERYRCPDSGYAATALYQRLDFDGDRIAGLRRQKEIGTAIATFNDAWDAGDIADLAAALGVAQECAAPSAKSGARDQIARERQRSTPLPATGILASRAVAS